ncbi:hypothetical protein HDV04_006238 [Boothiomyces sp. JEL0838]|nr:hypothetical protein HDV04_006238 [Boothiomyces sp. JEL0838]
MFLFNLILSTAAKNCISISSTTACNPWSKDLFIDADELSKVYGVKISSSDVWESTLIKTTSGGEEQSSLWKSWAGCSGLNGEMIQYLRSYVCLTDIFTYSMQCNEQAKNIAPLCDDTCEKYASALETMLSNPATCPAATGSVQGHREVLHHAGQVCKQENADKMFGDKSSCIKGVSSDTDYCGFAGNMKVVDEYCSKNSNSSCCLQMKSNMQNTQSKLASESNQPSSGVNLPLIVILSAGGCVVGALLLLVVRYRSKKKSTVSEDGVVATYEKVSKSPVETSQSFLKMVRSSLAFEDVQLGTRYIAKYDYDPQRPDEVQVRVGDIFEFTEVCDDGWGDCVNMVTNAKGKACVKSMEKL